MSLNSQPNNSNGSSHQRGSGDSTARLTGRDLEVQGLQENYLLPATQLIEDALGENGLNVDAAARVLLTGFPDGSASKLTMEQVTRNVMSAIPGDKPEEAEIVRAATQLGEAGLLHHVEGRSRGRRDFASDTFQIREEGSSNDELVGELLQHAFLLQRSLAMRSMRSSHTGESSSASKSSNGTSHPALPADSVQEHGRDPDRIVRLIDSIAETTRVFLADEDVLVANIAAVQEKQTQFQAVQSILDQITAHWDAGRTANITLHNPDTASPMQKAIAYGLKQPERTRGVKQATRRKMDWKIAQQEKGVNSALTREFSRGLDEVDAHLQGKVRIFRRMIGRVQSFVNDAEEAGLSDNPHLQDLKRKIAVALHDTDLLNSDEKGCTIYRMRADSLHANQARTLMRFEQDYTTGNLVEQLRALDEHWRAVIAPPSETNGNGAALVHVQQVQPNFPNDFRFSRTFVGASIVDPDLPEVDLSEIIPDQVPDRIIVAARSDALIYPKTAS